MRTCKIHCYFWLAAFVGNVAASLTVLAAPAPKASAMRAAQKLAQEGKAAYMARDYPTAATLFAEALKNVEHGPGLVSGIANFQLQRHLPNDEPCAPGISDVVVTPSRTTKPSALRVDRPALRRSSSVNGDYAATE